MRRNVISEMCGVETNRLFIHMTLYVITSQSKSPICLDTIINYEVLTTIEMCRLYRHIQYEDDYHRGLNDPNSYL